MPRFSDVALLLSLIVCILSHASCAQDPPANDVCANATLISSLPFTMEGTVTGATPDEWTIEGTCNFKQVSPGNGTWYKVEDMDGGVTLRALFSGMDAMLLVGTECGQTFSCADSQVGRDSNDPNDGLFYDFTTVRGQNHYMYVAPTKDFPGPKFTVSVTERTTSPTIAPVSTAPTRSAADRKMTTVQSLLLTVGFGIFATIRNLV
mmetsp:Transcript_17882/g.51888  ORF Transcript_17882/g.51888 Transcript_17882/m.51888 type:complete len:206 (-) Transcript_17882:443-1060(-)|eukprot:CAMPEP_0113527304 /NCGR_PEP_ID=MMETSP0015_2-20120614/1223_1 /TAXON_ID=2838 /ORGANISM="Odontella" /LENGTH=205 /DNA_ID=CAMNT_0000425727 /DNA_START=142 /DNA_END=759 /DNA_ORIENTATION=+ /assembly_acc=CAM_ASM_000160